VHHYRQDKCLDIIASKSLGCLWASTTLLLTRRDSDGLFTVDRAKVTNMKPPRKLLLRVIGCVLALAGNAAQAAQSSDAKVPVEVIDQAAAHGTVAVLVGLKVPWQMESGLTESQIVVQRGAIASIQADLLSELAGKSYRITRLYDQIPGIALEVGPDALAELAHSGNVVNVLLDRPAVTDEAPSADKVPSTLFKSVATNGTVLVLAGLRTPWQREDQLSEELIALQRKAILSAQSYILAELGGTQFRVLRLYRSIPGIALRVGLDALQVLQNSPAITNVVADRPVQRIR
jgi:hypothetical protein